MISLVQYSHLILYSEYRVEWTYAYLPISWNDFIVLVISASFAFCAHPQSIDINGGKDMMILIESRIPEAECNADTLKIDYSFIV